ncbi:MAG: DUF128 domain-containing protein [bacterium]
MKTEKNKIIIAILRVLSNEKKPIGATKISEQIKLYGIDLNQRTVRYYLAAADNAGFTKNLGSTRGRMITPAGLKELGDSFVIDKIGLIASKMDELAYSMDFSLKNVKGEIILNISTINSENLEKIRAPITRTFEKGLGMGNYIIFGKSNTHLGNYYIPEGKIGIGTVCSVTVNGIFLNEGIPIFSRFGGLLEIRNGKPARFTELINYNGTSLDPLEIFIKGQMTSVAKTAETGNGIIGASFREIPAIALPKAKKIKKRLDTIGLGGILCFGKPGQPLLDIPVLEGRAAMIVIGGLNPLAACEENQIETKNVAMGTLFDFRKLVPISANTFKLDDHYFMPR